MRPGLDSGQNLDQNFEQKAAQNLESAQNVGEEAADEN